MESSQALPDVAYLRTNLTYQVMQRAKSQKTNEIQISSAAQQTLINAVVSAKAVKADINWTVPFSFFTFFWTMQRK